MIQKFCKRCAQWKDESEFHLWQHHRIGYRYWICRMCLREQRKGRHSRRPNRSYNKRDPFITGVQARVRNAARKGIIEKPNQCSCCKTVLPKDKISAHHHNGYENIFDVIWLCQYCHSLAHMKNVSGGGESHEREKAGLSNPARRETKEWRGR